MSLSNEVLRSFDQALSTVAAAGLNVQAVLDSRRVTNTLNGLDVSSWPSLLLLGSTGPSLWEAMRSAGWLSRVDPVDSWCATRLSELRSSLPMRGVFVFPSRTPVDVLSLGRAAGWAHPTPLGLGMHPEHGLWLGYRGALLLDCAIPERGLRNEAPPCESCVGTPCVTACLGGAVEPGGLQISACFGQRLSDTPCAQSCASRAACPVGPSSRYEAPQVSHHHNSGNRLYRAYSKKEKS